MPLAIDDSRSACYEGSCVSFDGYVPTVLVGGSLVFTIHPTASKTEAVIFDFERTASYRGLHGVEVVIFNCPQWGVSAEAISVLGGLNYPPSSTSPDFVTINTINITTLTSCDSLVRVCVPVESFIQIIGLQFSLPPDSDWVHPNFTEFTPLVPMTPSLIMTRAITTRCHKPK